MIICADFQQSRSKDGEEEEEEAGGRGQKAEKPHGASRVKAKQ